jgi:hypothetical protein
VSHAGSVVGVQEGGTQVPFTTEHRLWFNTGGRTGQTRVADGHVWIESAANNLDTDRAACQYSCDLNAA